MAPQNSTLIHEHIESTSELNRFSPILPLKEKKNGNNVYSKKKSICSNTDFTIEQVHKHNILYRCCIFYCNCQWVK